MTESVFRRYSDAFHQTLTDEGAQWKRERLFLWRQEHAITRLERPTRLDRAHALGWRSKPGFIMVRVRVRRGGQGKRHIIAGRRPKHKGINKMTLSKSIQRIAEERAQRKYPNLEVLNSYWVGEDGKHKFYEVILVDRAHPVIVHDRRVNWVLDPGNRGRAYRGLTSAGKKGRGLRWKGKGAERMRPSRKANRKLEDRTHVKVIP
ncbi:MAG: 50S ribosomal protein L15e [Candidatus Thermoplasmatota archaeon]|jgi:large subunit ribosomal protein L15e|nr:50S ribosomal protein L15e [Candidatus Thermoplasmatota archaeon]